MGSEQVGAARRWWGLAVLGFGVALVVVDITIVNVAMPRIVANLDLEIADAEWINAAYVVVFATFLITLGRLGDAWGRRRLFVTGIVVFLVASVLAGGTGSLGGLVGARALQGLGAAMILPATLASVNATFRGRERAIAFGIWGSMIAGMAAVGPLVGGWLATTFSWRWVFYVNVPLALVTLVAALLLVTETREERAATGFDTLGFVTASVGFFGLVTGIIEGPRYGWLTPTRLFEVGGWSWPSTAVSMVPVAFAVGATALVAFVYVEIRRARLGRVVLFDMRLFRLRSFRHGNMLVTLVGLGEFGIVFVVPLYLQTVLRLSALQTGVLLLAMAAGGFIGGPLAAFFARRYGPRQVVTLGMGVEAVGALGMALLLSPTHLVGAIAFVLFMYGVGIGLTSSQLASVILAEVSPGDSGQASGMQSTFRQVGAALGIAILGTVFITAMSSLSGDRLGDIVGLTVGQRTRIVDSVADSAGWYIEALRAWTPDFRPVVTAVAGSITDAARFAAATAGSFFAVGMLLSRRLPDIMRDR